MINAYVHKSIERHISALAMDSFGISTQKLVPVATLEFTGDSFLKPFATRPYIA